MLAWGGLVPILLLDAHEGAIELLLWLLAAACLLGLSCFAGLLLALRLALDVKPNRRIEIFCISLTALHLLTGIGLLLFAERFGPLVLLGRASLIAGVGELAGIVIGKLRRSKQRAQATWADTD